MAAFRGSVNLNGVMHRLLPLLIALALVAQLLAFGADAPGKARSLGNLKTGYVQDGDTVKVERLSAGPARQLALRPGRARFGIPLVEYASRAVAPFGWRRWSRDVEFAVSGLGKSTVGLVWSLTAVHRSQAELRTARGRQTDP